MANNEFEISIEEPTATNAFEISLTGELTVNNSLPIYNFLLNKALIQNSVSIKIYDPVNVDLCFIQLLIGFIKSRNNENKTTDIEFNVDDSLLELLSKTGIDKTISTLQNEG